MSNYTKQYNKDKTYVQDYALKCHFSNNIQ